MINNLFVRYPSILSKIFIIYMIIRLYLYNNRKSASEPFHYIQKMIILNKYEEMIIHFKKQLEESETIIGYILLLLLLLLLLIKYNYNEIYYYYYY